MGPAPAGLFPVCIHTVWHALKSVMIFESMTLRSITTCPVPGNVLPFPGSTDLGLGLDLAILQVSRVGRDVGAAGMLEWGWGDHGEQILYIQRDTILLQDGNFSRQQPGIADKGL